MFLPVGRLAVAGVVSAGVQDGVDDPGERAHQQNAADNRLRGEARAALRRGFAVAHQIEDTPARSRRGQAPPPIRR